MSVARFGHGRQHRIKRVGHANQINVDHITRCVGIESLRAHRHVDAGVQDGQRKGAFGFDFLDDLAHAHGIGHIARFGDDLTFRATLSG